MKRRQKTILESFDKVMDEARGNTDSNGKNQEQKQVQRLKKVHLEQDEFTENKTIESALVTFVVDARQLEDHYQGHRKRMIQTVALLLEDELNRIGKSDLVCHISEELIKILKQTGIRWNAIYLRRCLDARYKDPVNRLNALARKQHPGVPEDTGLTAEALQDSLNRKPTTIVGEHECYKDERIKELEERHENLTDNLKMQIKSLKKYLSPLRNGAVSEDDKLRAILRHFKLCCVCFLNEEERKNTKKWTPRYIDGVYDRGFETYDNRYTFDEGLLCAEHRDEELAYLKSIDEEEKVTKKKAKTKPKKTHREADTEIA